MPVHDWTRVSDGIFQDFHLVWTAELRQVLNEGILPQSYAPGEQEADTSRQRTLVIRHTSEHRIVALIKIASAANKGSQDVLDTFDRGVAQFSRALLEG